MLVGGGQTRSTGREEGVVASTLFVSIFRNEFEAEKQWRTDRTFTRQDAKEV